MGTRRSSRVAAVAALLALAEVALVGCASRHKEAHTPSWFEQAQAQRLRTIQAIEGVWQCREEDILLELGRNKTWKWSERPMQNPLMEGEWYYEYRVLILRILQTRGDRERIGPGIALTYDIMHLDDGLMTLNSLGDEKSLNFDKIAEGGLTPNNLKPTSLTNVIRAYRP